MSTYGTAKFTPGPWEAGELPFDGSHVAKIADIYILVPHHIKLGNVIDDARLISAAPDQHAALQATQLLLERLGLESSDEYQRNAAAIAKALGGAA